MDPASHTDRPPAEEGEVVRERTEREEQGGMRDSTIEQSCTDLHNGMQISAHWVVLGLLVRVLQRYRVRQAIESHTLPKHWTRNRRLVSKWVLL